MKPAQTFDLFIDESGTFYENSYDPTELAALTAESGKKFPSQLAGVLTPSGEFTEAEAEKILKECHAQAGWPLPRVVHMKDAVEEAKSRGQIPQFRREYNRLIIELLRQLQTRGWRPVLLINREGVSLRHHDSDLHQHGGGTLSEDMQAKAQGRCGACDAQPFLFGGATPNSR